MTVMEKAEAPRRSGEHGGKSTARTLARLGLSARVDKLSGVYLLVILIVVYSVLEPQTFFTFNNLRIVLSGQAITGLITLGLMVSLISGVFDLSIAANVTWSVLFVGWLQSADSIPWGYAVVLTLCSGVLIGVANAIVVTKLHVDAVIGTLGMSSVLAALAYLLTNGEPVTTGISEQFTNLGNASLFSIPVTVFVLAGVALLLWYMLNYTPVGRYLYAVGSNLTAARLAGLKVTRLQWTGLIVSATVASFAGVCFCAQVGSANTDAGSPYLLAAFSAAFLGATQIRPGRFNVWGTIVAIYLLAVGVKGLDLHWTGMPWIDDMFDGLALIVAVTLAVRSARRRARAEG